MTKHCTGFANVYTSEEFNKSAKHFVMTNSWLQRMKVSGTGIQDASKRPQSKRKMNGFKL